VGVGSVRSGGGPTITIASLDKCGRQPSSTSALAAVPPTIALPSLAVFGAASAFVSKKKTGVSF